MKSDLYTAIAQIAAERGIPRDAVLASVQDALTSVYKKNANTDENVRVELDSATGEMQVIAVKTVAEQVEDPNTEMSVAEAQQYLPGAQAGDVLRIEKTPENFGRIAAQTVKQVVHSRIRDFERENVYREYKDK
jgi:N utilization substance protein A